MPKLYFQDFPGPDDDGTPLLLLHGLFGSSANWRGIARRLSDERRVLVPDMRNHGRSFHDEAMSYPDMAQDIIDTLDDEGIERADLLGHSMGGKAAMVAALENPQRVGHLIVVDIAPVIYTHTHLPLIDAMLSVDISSLKSRSEADEQLKPTVDDAMTRQFLLHSLEKADKGYRWRLHLEGLRRSMGELIGFPDLEGRLFDGPALFVYGAQSDYVQPEHHTRIERYFPNAEYAAIDNAGHWVHAEQPAALVDRTAAFLAE